MTNRYFIGFLGLSAVLFIESHLQAEFITSQDLDVVYISTNNVVINTIRGNGDFNGDGYEDAVVAYFSDESLNDECMVIFGGPSLSNSELLNIKKTKINGLTNLPISKIAVAWLDMNDDPFDDLAIMDESKGFVILGSSSPPESVDLRQANSHVSLNYSAVGDMAVASNRGSVDGDPYDDLLFMQKNRRAYLFWGKKNLAHGQTYNLDDGVSAVRFHTSSGNLTEHLAMGDLNNDGKSEIILTTSLYVHIIKGTDTIATPRDLYTNPGDLYVSETPQTGFLSCLMTTDWTGDGVADMVLEIVGTNKKFIIFDGLVVGNYSGFKDVNTGFPGYNPTVINTTFASIATLSGGDFDGDGEDDIVLCRNSLYQTMVFLSSDYSNFSKIEDPSFTLLGGARSALGDINGDGKKDLLIVGPFAFNQMDVGFYYGSQPLKNLSVTIRPNPSLPRAMVTFSVSGEPVEMFVSGDIQDSIKNEWVPFQAQRAISLTETAGSKTVSVIFRDKFGRQSEEAKSTVLLSPEGIVVETINNVIEPGSGPARVDCRLDRSALVVATVHDQSGVEIARIQDGNLGPGVWPMEWDGFNEGGRAVGSGIYYLTVQVDERVEKRKILVRR